MRIDTTWSLFPWAFHDYTDEKEEEHSNFPCNSEVDILNLISHFSTFRTPADNQTITFKKFLCNNSDCQKVICFYVNMPYLTMIMKLYATNSHYIRITGEYNE
jgi:hypothetical protein